MKDIWAIGKAADTRTMLRYGRHFGKGKSSFDTVDGAAFVVKNLAGTATLKLDRT